MSKIERRRTVVKLHHGNYEAELAALLDEVMAAQRAEDAGDVQHLEGEKSSSEKLATQYDAKLAEAEASAVDVTLWALSWDEWDGLSDAHPPRSDVAADPEQGTAAEEFAVDKQRGVNMKTFPASLLRLSLVEPGSPISRVDKESLGAEILRELGPSRIHYAKLETAAWNVNVGDDALPKFSLVSFLKEARDPDSKPPSDSE